MESVINDHLGSGASGSFASKWVGVLNNSGAAQADLDNFDNYLANIYRRMRNKVVHPSARTGVIDASRFSFSHAHENLKYGWFTFVFLLNHQHGAAMDYDDNWKTMAEAHSVPAVINPGDYPNLGTLAGQMMKVHLDHLNAGS
jgi:hypothetical protein